MGKPVNKTLRIAAMSAGEEIGHVSGPIVTFRGNGDPLRSLLVNIEPVQDLHGYDNPWPAGGGKNLFNPDSTRTVWVGLDGSISQRAAAKSVSLQASEGQAFTASMTNLRTASNLLLICFFDNDNAMLTRNLVAGGEKAVTATAPANTATILCSAYTYSEAGNVQLEIGSSATTFAPYSNLCPISGWDEANVWVKPTYDPTANPTATIQLGQTVYGGTLDVTNGVLTVDRAMVDLGTLNYSSGFSGFYTLGIKDDIKVPTAVAQSGLQSDVFIVGNTPNADNMYIQFSSAYVGWVVFLPSATYSTAADFKAAMNGHQLCYTLATPITIPLTPQEIATLQGQNNVWADSGDVDVEYIATGGEGGKLALLLRNRKELLIALRKGLTPAEAGLLNSTPLLGGFVRPGLSTDDEKEEDELI